MLTFGPTVRAFLVIAVANVTSQTASAAPVGAIAIIPQPHALSRGEGSFRFNAETKLVTPAADQAAEAAAAVLHGRLSTAAGLPLPAGTEGASSVENVVIITTKDADASLSAEGYTLDVTEKAITVRSTGAAGLFYGVQSLLQLLPPAAFGSTPVKDVAWEVPCVSIRDQPRFGWRGAMLDVSRHLFKKEEIFRLLDAMAMHKQNVFHWHLTDDQGWRIEVKRYPRLTEVGAWRDDIGWGFDRAASDRYDANGRYGGFFTQQDVRDVVAYAAARHITVVPEFEMPGHATAALASYPELSCTGGPFQVLVNGGVFDDVYCAGNDATFTFLENMLDEVLPLFPSTYIHVGGDECPKTRWKTCPKCQARMKAGGLKDEDELQSYFIRRMERFLNGRGKRLIGWDEILEGGLPPNATVMSWRGVKGGIAAAQSGHDAVMSPTTHCYLDYHQTNSGETPMIGPLLPLEKVYSYEPIPPELTPEQARHVRGVQGNLWTEYVPNFERASYQFFPRITAIAEIGWSKREGRDFADFAQRLQQDELRLDAMGMTYRPLPPAGIEDAIRLAPDGESVVIASPVSALSTHATLDGTDPTRETPKYERPIALPASGVVVARARFFRPGTAIGYYSQKTFINRRPSSISTNLGQHEAHAAAGVFDADPATFFWGSRGVRAGDHFTVTFETPQLLRTIKVVTGKPDGGDALADGVLEVSRGDATFAAVAQFKDGVAEATLDGIAVSAVRLRVRSAAKEWLAIREFTLH